MTLKVGIAGATGLVGQTLLEILQENPLNNNIELFLGSSDRTAGTLIGDKYLISMQELSQIPLDIVFFMTDEDVSREWIPKFLKNGTCVIDNSSAFRMENDVPLVVAGINNASEYKNKKLIANPNCSTIQLAWTIYPLLSAGIKIKKIVVATYQSVSGAGKNALHQLECERKGTTPHTKYWDIPIFDNLIPNCGGFINETTTKEEWKIENELKKIFKVELDVISLAVRIPVSVGHSQAVFMEANENLTVEDIVGIYNKHDEYVVVDFDIKSPNYGVPINVKKSDRVHISRIRIKQNSIAIFNCANNLRVGAATNALRIAQTIMNGALRRNN